MNFIRERYKAVAGGVAASLMYLIPVVDDGLAPSEALYAVLAFLVGAGLVNQVPNRKG